MFTMPPVQAEKQIKKPSAIQNPSSPVRTLGMVGVTGLEPAASRPPDVCATSCATPRYSLLKYLYSIAEIPLIVKDFFHNFFEIFIKIYKVVLTLTRLLLYNIG